jgi:oligopeptide/dipeptide ABC transporter ATP-binding protein
VRPDRGLYAGKVVELGPTEDLLEHPLHTYTRALTSAVPVPDPTYEQPEVEIRGGVSKPINPPPICRCDRCPWGDEVCDANDHPALEEVRPGHLVACYHARKHM